MLQLFDVKKRWNFFDENQNKFMLRRYSFELNDKIEEDLFNYSLKIPKRVIK